MDLNFTKESYFLKFSKMWNLVESKGSLEEDASLDTFLVVSFLGPISKI